MRLTRAQWEALSVCETGRPVSSDFWRMSGVHLNTTNALTRRGLLEERQYANGPHWEITEAGRLALVDRYRDPKTGTFNFPTDVAAIVRRLDVAEAKVSALTEALERSGTALDDWLNIYASDLCAPERVAEAQQRIAQFGTIGYIADVQQQNRTALSHRGTE